MHRRLLAWFLLGALAGCGSGGVNADLTGGRGSGGGSGGGVTPGGPPTDEGSGGGGTPGVPATGGSGGGSGGVVTGGLPDAGGPPIDNLPGVLTAGAWDDNLNFDLFLAFVTATDAQQVEGLPMVERRDRMTIDVVDGAGVPVAGATVAVTAAGASQPTWSVPVAAEGRALFFPTRANVATGVALTITATAGNASATAQSTAGTDSVKIVLDTVAAKPNALDVAFVVDTTGSMGDELSYLQTEFSHMADEVAAAYPNVDQRWAFVAYRDVGMGDAYTVQSHDFTSDRTAFQQTLSAQYADGGGDYPESPELGIDAASQLAWRDGATARLAFWVADAPHHAGHEGALLDAIDHLRARGAHIYPVAASGTDVLLEYSMRTAAELSGGRYLFLTDDSGIGDPHETPSIPCYVVTKLSHALARMMSLELTGAAPAVAPDEVIRTVGDPQKGTCTVGDGVAYIL
jgi:hypothetical protein